MILAPSTEGRGFVLWLDNMLETEKVTPVATLLYAGHIWYIKTEMTQPQQSLK